MLLILNENNIVIPYQVLIKLCIEHLLYFIGSLTDLAVTEMGSVEY